MSTSGDRRIPKTPVDTPLALFLWGGKAKFDRRRSLLNAFGENAIFSKSNVVLPSLSRKDAWTRAALQARELIALQLKFQWSHDQFMEAVRLTDNFLPVQPQFRIFLSNLERQMSDEQKAEWIPKAERFEIFGSYAQTELGHGSNVRGIETTATFDRESDSFVIDSPTLSSSKYWIGATGVWATHSLVVAKLLVNGKNHGNHLFLVQIRDLSTHRLMPGVEIYELGPKAFQGMLGTDNGAMQFHNVRIPRSQMLCRNAQVLRDGSYVKPKNEKHSYGSMITVRAIMAEITGWDLLKAVATTYHYTSFRKQFWGKSNGDVETTVIEYASVRHRLVPLLAQGTALVLVGQKIKRAYDDYTAHNLKTGDFSRLEDFHLQTIGSKVYSTEIAGHGIETMRIACGGHGYNALSGFGRMYANAINAVTYEGDNYLVAQQVPRAILKHLKNKTENGVPTLSYLTKLREGSESAMPDITTETDWFNPDVQAWALEQRLVNLVKIHVEDTNAGKDTSYNVFALTMAHGDLVYWNGFRQVLQDLERANQPYFESIKALFLAYSLSILQQPHHSSLAFALPLNSTQQNLLRLANAKAIEHVAVNHLAEIMEQGYAFTEYEMDSALARADHTPYEALWEGAKQSEMSGTQMSHLWPMFIDTRHMWKRVQREPDPILGASKPKL